MVGAVHHRDGTAPVALSREKPVPQTEIDLSRSDALLLVSVAGEFALYRMSPLEELARGKGFGPLCRVLENINRPVVREKVTP